MIQTPPTQNKCPPPPTATDSQSQQCPLAPKQDIHLLLELTIVAQTLNTTDTPKGPPTINQPSLKTPTPPHKAKKPKQQGQLLVNTMMKEF